jgi:hypothetical protein
VPPGWLYDGTCTWLTPNGLADGAPVMRTRATRQRRRRAGLCVVVGLVIAVMSIVILLAAGKDSFGRPTDRASSCTRETAAN